MKLKRFPLFAFWAISVFAAQPYHANLRMENIPPGEELVTFAFDGSGDVFTVGYVTDAFGQTQMRADKFDPSGNSLGGLEFATVGGLFQDSVAAVAVDPSGNLVVAGSTGSGLTLTGAGTLGEAGAFIVKLDSQLKTVLSSTTLGAKAFTTAEALTIDRSGNIYVTGQTEDANFPVTVGAFQTRLPVSLNGSSPTYAFVTKFAPDGKTIVFSTYFGNSTVPCDPASEQCPAYAETYGSAIALDGAGDIVIGGYTNASQLPFPATAFQSSCGACGEDASGFVSYAAFVAKFSGDGTKLLAGTYIPVSAATSTCDQVDIEGLALDGAGNIIVVGMTSGILPITAALQAAFPGASLTEAGFILKFDPSAQQLAFGTYFGGSGTVGQFGYGAVDSVAVDQEGTIWVTGASPPEQLPAPTGTALLGGVYLAGLSSDGASLEALFTAPQGFAGLALASTTAGVSALGTSGALLTAVAGAGPSLVAVTNSAASAPAIAIAPYELVTLYGIGIGPAMAASGVVTGGVLRNSVQILGDSIEGVQVLFNGTPAPLLYAGPAQINAIVPREVVNNPTATIQIVTPSGTLNGPAIPVSPSQPGVVLSAGQSSDTSLADTPLPVAAALNQDGTVNSAANPAALGSIVSVWVSGAGLSTYPVADGTVRTSTQTGEPTLQVAAFAAPLDFFAILPSPSAVAGALSTEVVYAADAPGMVAGVTQVNFLIPSQIQSGLSQVGFGLPGVPYAFWLQVGDAASEQFTVYAGPGGTEALGVAP